MEKLKADIEPVVVDAVNGSPVQSAPLPEADLPVIPDGDDPHSL